MQNRYPIESQQNQNTINSQIQQQNASERPNQHPLANYQFSSDELRVLKECNRESFFQRSLPFGTGAGVAAYFAVKNGYLKPSARFGATPKVILGVILGYFIGKFSYRSKCAEKIMQLPNSKLAELLRRRNAGSFYESLTPDQGLGAGFALAPFTSATEHYTDESLKGTQGNALDLDVERPTASGLDDYNRPNVDGPATTFDDDLPLEPPKQSVTYDELRKQNRDEYARKTRTPYRQADTPPPIIRSNESPYSENVPLSQKGKKNQYGDDWTT